MYKSILFFLSFLLFVNSQAQDEQDNYRVGHYFDLNKQPIDGYYDFDYEPKKSLKVSFTIGESYTPGYYYTREGLKKEGWLRYSASNSYFKFKKDNNDKEHTIKPDECNGYVIGADSFAVIQNFDIQRDLGGFHTAYREFAEVIDKVGNFTFYKHTKANTQNYVETYVVKKDGTNNYVSFPKGTTKFKELCLDVFGSSEYLKQGILAIKYYNDDIPSMIKILKYNNHYDQKSRICFNSSWDEIETCNDCAYYAKVEDLHDSILHIAYYFNNDIKIYEGDFYSLYPHKKKGNFTFYYLNGAVRKKLKYKDNKPQSAIDYYTSGKIHRKYSIAKKRIEYQQVYDITGKSLLDELGNGNEVCFDSINQREITYEYFKNKLTYVYYFDKQEKKIFQLCKRNTKLLEYQALKLKINNDLKYPTSAIKEYHHGYLLLKCIVEPNGLVSKIEIIKSMDEACNTKTLDFIDFFSKHPHWAPAIYKGERVTQEVILPIDFVIKGFSRYRNHYNNMWMQQNMMMQQQMMIMHMTPMAPTFH